MLLGMGLDLGLQFAPAGGVSAQSLGVEQPDCGGGSPYLDATGEWACTAPPVKQSTGAGSFIVALLVAGLAYFVFAGKTTRAASAAASGNVGKLLKEVS